MNHSEELHQVMSSVPTEAWPNRLLLVGQWWHVDTSPIPVVAAEQMCVGSMTNYLLVEGHHYFEYIIGDVVTLKMYNDLSVCVPLDFGRVQTQTRLLAKACEIIAAAKEVQGG